MLLGCFIWALPDAKYQYWLKNKLWLYYTMSVLNFMLAVFGLIAGVYFYMMGPALYSFLAAALLLYIFLAVLPLLASIVISFILV